VIAATFARFPVVTLFNVIFALTQPYKQVFRDPATFYDGRNEACLEALSKSDATAIMAETNGFASRYLYR